jgi:hypothetical protein
VEPITAFSVTMMVFVAAIVAAMLTHFIRQSYNIRITVSRGRVEVDGSALASRRAAVEAFFAECLPAVQSARLYGHWDGRRLSLYGYGVGRGELQRLRNYLTTEL